jgi:hypothetical protein
MRRFMITAMMAIAAGSAVAFNEHPMLVDGLIKGSPVVGIARVAGIAVQETRCESTTRVRLEPVRFLKGDLGMQEIAFSHTRHHPKRAIFPWQEDCPAVSYTAPPTAEEMKVGDEVIFAAKYFPDLKVYLAIATMRMDQMQRVMGLLGKK